MDVAQLAADLGVMIADLPSLLVYSGQTATGTRSEITRSNDVAADGILNIADLQWVGKVSELATMPNVQATVAVDGANYHIVTRALSQDGVAVTFQLKRV